MRKHGFLIRKRSNDTVIISTSRMVWTVDFLPRSPFEERVEAVKRSLFIAGFVWTDEVEKMVREKLS